MYNHEELNYLGFWEKLDLDSSWMDLVRIWWYIYVENDPYTFIRWLVMLGRTFTRCNGVLDRTDMVKQGRRRPAPVRSIDRLKNVDRLMASIDRSLWSIDRPKLILGYLCWLSFLWIPTMGENFRDVIIPMRDLIKTSREYNQGPLWPLRVRLGIWTDRDKPIESRVENVGIELRGESTSI